MLTIGLMGNTKIGQLVLDVVDKEKYQYLDMMRADRLASIKKIGVLLVLARFLRFLKKVDVVLYVSPDPRANYVFKLAKKHNKKSVAFWIGTDVYRQLRKEMRPIRNEHIDMHLAVGDRLIGELSTIGFMAQNLYCPSDLSQEILPMPKKHAVLLSIPDGSADFYGYKTFVRLIKECPDIPFIITRSERPDMYDYPNVDFRGLVNREGMTKAFADSTISIRIPEHDGIGIILVESMIKGRDVIANYDIPHTYKVQSYDELKKTLLELVSKPPELNKEAHDYAVYTFGKKKCAEDFDRYMNELFA